MTESIMLKKPKTFALRIVRLYKCLREHKESVIAKQMLRSGIRTIRVLVFRRGICRTFCQRECLGRK